MMSTSENRMVERDTRDAEVRKARAVLYAAGA
jgi:hypothetical protein